MDLQSRVALITGGSRGLGREIARLYAERGAKLALVARGGRDLAAAAEQLTPLTEVLAIPADVSQQAETVAQRTLDHFGQVDVLVNNASGIGPSPMPRLAEYPWEELLALFRLNAVAQLHLTQLLLPGMLERGEGVILNVTSDAATQAYPGWGGYGASKAAFEQLSRVLAAELQDTGIRVYLVDPGDMNTAMHRRAEPGKDLSHLPEPWVPAPAFVYLVERETAARGRFEALRLVEETARLQQA